MAATQLIYRLPALAMLVGVLGAATGCMPKPRDYTRNRIFVTVDETTGEAVSAEAKSAEVTDADIEFLSGLTTLKWISLDGTKISDDGLSSLGYLPEVHMITLNDTPLRGNGFTHLRLLPKLDTLLLDRVPLTKQGLKELAGLGQVNAVSLKEVPLPKNTKLDLVRSRPDLLIEWVPPPSRKHQKAAIKLRSLGATIDWIGGDVSNGVAGMFGGKPGPVALYVWFDEEWQGGRDDLRLLADLDALYWVSFDERWNKGYECFEVLSELRRLDFVSIEGKWFTDGGLDHLSEIKGLSKLHLRETRTTDAAIQRAFGKMPDLVIEHDALSDE